MRVDKILLEVLQAMTVSKGSPQGIYPLLATNTNTQNSIWFWKLDNETVY